MDLLIMLGQVLLDLTHQPKLQHLFAEANSAALMALSQRLLTNHMLAPLALRAHDLLLRTFVHVAGNDGNSCDRTAVNMAVWSSRIIRPARLCLSTTSTCLSPVSAIISSCGIDDGATRAFNTEWHQFCNTVTVEQQTDDVLQALKNDVSYNYLPQSSFKIHH